MFEPSDEMVKRLIDLKVVVIKDDGYDYTDEFKDSIRQYLKKPLGNIAKIKLAKNIAVINAPIFKTFGLSVFKDKKSVDLLNTVTLFFVYYMQKRKMDYILKDEDIRNIIYAMFYLDQKIPDVEV
jgi:translation elongation factor EF-G